MYKLRSFFYKNKKEILITIFIIITCFVILRMINGYYSKKNNDRIQEITNSVKESNKNINVDNYDFDLSESKKSMETLNNDEDTIEKFIDFCNKSDIKNAYNMLTNECKENLYKTEEIFKSNYYDKMFNGKIKSCIIENWNGKTYRIKLQDDILSTGKMTDEGYLIDYITIKNVNKDPKLNISSFIRRTQILKAKEYNGLNVKVNYKDIYMDYEIYNFTFFNNTKGKILINELEESESLYIEDKKGAKYFAEIQELTKSNLLIGINGKNVVSIKFNNIYRSNKEIRKIVFSNIIYNYNNIEQREDFEMIL